MPPRLRLRPRFDPGQLLARRSHFSSRPTACLFCSLQLGRPRTLPTGRSSTPLRTASTSASPIPTQSKAPTEAITTGPSTTRNLKQARADLVDALNALQKHAGVLVNLARLQLAIRGLQQEPGRESIRVAVLGLANDSSGGSETASGTAVAAGNSAKELLRLILADPLKEKEPWEAQLAAHDTRRPLIVRVRGQGEVGDGSSFAALSSRQDGTAAVKFDKDGALPEIEVASPAFNGHKIEFLVMEATRRSLVPPTPPAGFEGETENLEETVLVPTVEIPASQDGSRFTPVTAPVHQALIVADGFLGAAATAALPLLPETKDEIRTAVNLRGFSSEDETPAEPYPFATFDAAAAAKALALFRESVSNAHAYETLWLRGGVRPLAAWLKEGAHDRADGATKGPVRRLVVSVLRNTLAAVQDAEAKQVAAVQRGAPGTQTTSSAPLHAALADWAEAAHAELQSELDAAFVGSRWRQLGWWKLFWRVDDVTLLAAGLVRERFLPKAEQEAVYLAGRIGEAARPAGALPAGKEGEEAANLYAAPTFASDTAENVTATAATATTTSTTPSSEQQEPAEKEPSAPPLTPSTPSLPPTKWPTHIDFTRRYLLGETVPALQALAQKLVLQTAATSGLTTALAALTYLSSLGAYEAGAVAALGYVWSLGSMQKRWETARQFWEGEVREEGRKAVRAVEASVGDALERTARDAGSGGGGEGAADRRRVVHDLREARALVERAQEAFARLK